jgi:predicted RNA-binding protein with PUA-like domain
MNYWILKSEPSTYSFSDLLRDKKTCWDGIRNYLARNNLRAMHVGDIALFYHSGDDKAVVGISKIVKLAYQDPKTEENWSAVDIKSVKILKRPVTLSELKADKVLKNIQLVKQSRLSVSPLTNEEYNRIIDLSQS